MAYRLRYRDAAGKTYSSLTEPARGGAEPLNVATVASRTMLGPPRPTMEATLYATVRSIITDEDPLPSLGDLSTRSIDEASLALRRGVERAVAHAVGSASTFAVQTGGGLDSAVLAAVAHAHAKRTGRRVFLVAIDFGGAGDDRPHLRVLERALGCEVVRVTPEDGARYGDLFETGVDAAPFAWPAIGLEIAAHVAAREAGAEILVSGVGGDELLDGEPVALAAGASRHPLRALARARRLRGFFPEKYPRFTWVVRPMLARLQPKRLRLWRALRGALDVEPWADSVLREQARAIRDEHARWAVRPTGSPSWAPLAHPTHEWALSFLHQIERISRLPVRLPFRERAMGDLVDRIPPAWLLAGDVRRGLFRKAFRDLLPASIIDRIDKADFAEAHHRFLQAWGGFDRLRPYRSVDELAALGIVKRSEFEKAFDEFERGEAGELGMTLLWPVLAVEAFLRHRRRSLS